MYHSLNICWKFLNSHSLKSKGSSRPCFSCYPCTLHLFLFWRLHQRQLDFSSVDLAPWTWPGWLKISTNISSCHYCTTYYFFSWFLTVRWWMQGCARGSWWASGWSSPLRWTHSGTWEDTLDHCCRHYWGGCPLCLNKKKSCTLLLHKRTSPPRLFYTRKDKRLSTMS